jgi:hypothetical protein
MEITQTGRGRRDANKNCRRVCPVLTAGSAQEFMADAGVPAVAFPNPDAVNQVDGRKVDLCGTAIAA